MPGYPAVVAERLRIANIPEAEFEAVVETYATSPRIGMSHHSPSP